MVGRRWIFLLGLCLLPLLLGACQEDEAPPANADAPILTGQNDLPKKLATVIFSPTPDANSIIILSPTVAPSLTSEPPEPTYTPTAYVGVYIGPQSSGTPLVAITTPILEGPQSNPIFPATPTAPLTACTTPIGDSFRALYTQNLTLAQQLGCPSSPSFTLRLVYQPFERGTMFWRETKEIYVLQANQAYVRLVDTWDESQPDRDPGIVPPAGLLQPIRGFGLAWRSNTTVRDGLGWATSGEAAYDATWQDFERGALFIGNNGRVYAILAGGTYLGPL